MIGPTGPAGPAGPAGSDASVTASTITAALGFTPASTAYLRERLTAARTYYVRTDGNNSNNGLANTAGGAFLTIMAAVAAAYRLDLGGHGLTIQIADGTYAEYIVIDQAFVGGAVTINGNATTPTNVVLNAGGAVAGVYVFGTGAVRIGGVAFVNSVYSLYVYNGGDLLMSAPCVITGAGAAAIVQTGGSTVRLHNTLTLAGSFSNAFSIADDCYYESAGQLAFASNPSIGILVYCFNSRCYFASTFVGTFTGCRFYVSTGGVIRTGTNNLNHFPGTAAGIVAKGGQFDGVIYSEITPGMLDQALPDVIIEDQKPSGTPGGASVANSFVARAFNTLLRNTIGATLVGNQFTLQAGLYRIRCSAPAFAVGTHKILLVNVTDGAYVGIGSSEFSGSGAQTRSFSDNVVELAAAKTFELRQYTQLAAANGRGVPTQSSLTETYARVEIWKIG